MPLDIDEQPTGDNIWPSAATISVVFALAVMIVLYALNRAGRMSKAYGDGR